MATDWNIEKDMTIKKRVTHDIVNLFPDCSGKSLCLMTSLSCNELRELVSQGKIDGGSFLCNIDNLSSVETKQKWETKSVNFSEAWKKKSNEIFKDGGVKIPKSKLVFKNIFSVPLTHIANGRKFKVVYADSCNTMTDDFMDWINCGATIDGVEDDGVFAFTVALNHTSSLQLEESNEPIDCSVFQFSAYRYDNIENMMHYARKLSSIKSFIESKGFWKVERMIHYCEQNRKSQMATILCSKKKI